MKVKQEFVAIIVSGLFQITIQSIAGLTYMDDYDFEEKYRDVTECDPFHWYPLHLPEYCADMYSKLIRQGIPSATPLRVRKIKENFASKMDPSSGWPILSIFDEQFSLMQHGGLSPNEKLFDMLRKDVLKQPGKPKVTNYPGVGPVALYNQAVSKKSGDYIKKMSAMYRDSVANYPYPYFQVPTNQSAIAQHHKIPSHEDGNVKKKNNHKITKILKNGNLLTIINSLKAGL